MKIMFDYKAAVDDLSILNRAVSVFDNEFEEQTEEFIRVGEYSLALDDIASAYLVNEVSMPANLFRIFEKLALAMNVGGDDEYASAAKLLKAGRP